MWDVMVIVMFVTSYSPNWVSYQREVSMYHACQRLPAYHTLPCWLNLWVLGVRSAWAEKFDVLLDAVGGMRYERVGCPRGAAVIVRAVMK